MNSFHDIRIVVLGDSHAAFLGNPQLSVADSLPEKTTVMQDFRAGSKKILIDFIYLGPQLAHNFLIDDTKTSVNYEGANVAFFYLGEIDIRVHLAKKRNAHDTARIYAERVFEFCSKRSIESQFILPPAPANFGFVDPNFPKVGTLAERRIQHYLYCRSLRESSILLGLREPIGYDSSYGKEVSLAILESDDGCHLNAGANEYLLKVLVNDVIERFIITEPIT